MSQKSIIFAIFSFIFSGFAVASSTPDAMSCQLLESGEEPRVLDLKIKRSETVIDEEDPRFLEGEIEVTSSVPGLDLNTSGAYQHVKRNQLDLERIDYEPLQLLGLNEWDIGDTTFYYMKEDPLARDLDLILVSVFRRSEGPKNEQTYAGSYGTYRGRNLLCPLELDSPSL